MWPAMWWAAFNADDELNAQTADDYAIVMGTSHHEPMNKAYAEWHNTPHGAWDYSKNPKELEEFWDYFHNVLDYQKLKDGEKTAEPKYLKS